MSGPKTIHRDGATLRVQIAISRRARHPVVVTSLATGAMLAKPDEVRIAAVEDRLAFTETLPHEHRTEAAALLDQLAIDLIGAPRADEGLTASGEELGFPRVDPWEDAVDIAALLAEVTDLITMHVVVAREIAALMALWVVHTYCIAAADFTPYLWVFSATKGCGKTTLLELLAKLARRCVMASNASGAALYLVGQLDVTLVLDELDSFLHGDRAEDIRNILNAGFKRGGRVLRGAVRDNQLVPTWYDVFFPKVLGGIGKRLPDTTISRSIPIQLPKATRDELRRIDRPRDARLEARCAPVRRKLARWSADHLDDLRDVDPTVPEALIGRPADIYAPLFAIADMAGVAWGKEARATAVSLALSAPVNDDAKELILVDFHRYFTQHATDRVRSDEIVRWLNEQEHRPWPKRNKGAGIRPPDVAELLDNFDIHPRSRRFPGGDNKKGYVREEFIGAWAKYVPDDTTEDVTPCDGTPVAIELPAALKGNSVGADCNDGDRCDGGDAPDPGVHVLPDEVVVTADGSQFLTEAAIKRLAAARRRRSTWGIADGHR